MPDLMDKTLDAFILQDEGERLRPYWDTNGWLTIGVGHNLGVYVPDAEIRKKIILPPSDVITLDVSRHLLRVDVQTAERELTKIFPEESQSWNPACYYALVGMMFNLGALRFLRFRKLIEAIRMKDHMWAAREILDSTAARQLPRRYTRYADMVRFG